MVTGGAPAEYVVVRGKATVNEFLVTFTTPGTVGLELIAPSDAFTNPARAGVNAIVQ